MNFAIYSRKSVYTGKGESVENQIEMCKKYIYSKFGQEETMDITIYEDEGFSAKNTERPQFKRMISELKHKAYDYIVCYRLDRISRNVSDFAALIEDLNDRNISFICISEEFDTSKPMGKAMMYIASVFAQLERETIAERVRDNMLLLARTGRWLGGTTPTGYSSEKVQEIIIDGKIKTACRLITDSHEIEIVRTMGDKLLELGSISAVSKYLIHSGIKSRTGKYFSLPGIKEILSNPVYCIADTDGRNYFLKYGSDVCFEESECSDHLGLLSYNKRSHQKKHMPRLPKSQWIIAVGKHDGIFSGKQWIYIQHILDSKKLSVGKVKSHNDYALLSGLIICNKCGAKMFAKAHQNRSRNGRYYYICQSKQRGGLALCDCENLSGQNTDDIIFDFLIPLFNELINPRKIYKELKKMKSQLSKANENTDLEMLKKQLETYDLEMDTLVNSLTRSVIGDVLIQKINLKIEDINTCRSLLLMKIENLEQSKPDIYENFCLSKCYNTIFPLYCNLDLLSISEKKRLIQSVVSTIDWDGECLTLNILT